MTTSTRLLTAIVSSAAACGGSVTVGGGDASTDFGTPPVPYFYDATFGAEANGGVISPPIGSSGASSRGGSSGGSSSPVGLCPASCRTDTDCAGCALPAGSTSKNCCVMGICALMASCPTNRSAGGGAQSDAGACSPVLASAYDQSCVADTDCVGVGEVPQCPASECDGCLTQAVNAGAAAQYNAALSRAFASEPPGEVCNCPAEAALAICRGGRCEYGYGSFGPLGTDTLPACADAGGRCSYAANTTCGTVGPPDACAYADEICCL